MGGGEGRMECGMWGEEDGEIGDFLSRGGCTNYLQKKIKSRAFRKNLPPKHLYINIYPRIT